GAIAEGQQRRANRRTCLLIRGWRLIELPAPEAKRIATMSGAQRSAYFDTVVGAATLEGKVTELTSFSMKSDPALRLHGPVAGVSAVYLGKDVDPAVPVTLAPGEGAVVLAFRRPDEGSAGRSGGVLLSRYDPEARDLVHPPAGAKKAGDRTTYGVVARSADRKAALEVQVLRLTAGDYVLAAASIGPGTGFGGSYCFGAPTFHVGDGEVVYLGDFVPFWNVRLSTGERLYGLGYTWQIDEVRGALARSQPALAAAMQPAIRYNRATYACAAVGMSRWDLPGLEELPGAP
ncbi:MAG TPA: hypothetical protein VGD66_03955, partial [Allosphingosinicella sp.]